MPAWIATGIALVALGFSLWTWFTNRRDSTKRDHEARVARVNEKFVELSKMARRASQGSPDATNAVLAAQRDLATAIAAAHLEFPACDAVTHANGVIEILTVEDASFREVAKDSADLARGPRPGLVTRESLSRPIPEAPLCCAKMPVCQT